jgi:hypothetical protein
VSIREKELDISHNQEGSVLILWAKLYFMKHLLAVTLLLFSITCHAQTDQLEKDNLTRRFENKEFSSEEFRTLAGNWRQVRANLGGYPQLPYDTATKAIVFKKVLETKQSRAISYSRIMEWAAINFGSIDAVLQYGNSDDGKIILKGYFDVTHDKEVKNFWGQTKSGYATTKCFQTFVFTIKEGRVKAEVRDLKYEYSSGGYLSGSIYIPRTTIKTPIESTLPITNWEKNRWVEMLDLLSKTTTSINDSLDQLQKYISNYEKDYGF